MPATDGGPKLLVMTPSTEAAQTRRPAHAPAGSGHAHRPAATEAEGPRGATSKPSLNRLAFNATAHCLTGCAIGEVLGMIIGTALGWSALRTIALAVALAFVFGYALTSGALVRAGMPLRAVVPIALTADTISIAVMEIVDNATMIAIPGAMSADVDHPMFWASLAIALLSAGCVAYPANRWLIARGKGHAVVHAHHRH
jgi:hypothetical protein